MSCCSRADRVGRDGFLRLVFERRGGETILTGRRFALPLQALEPTRLADGSLYIMMLNPTGGIFGGDRLRTEIVIGAGTHVILTTPSASKIYRALDHPARCETEIVVGEDAVVEYLPDHLIPHPDAALRQSLRVSMARGSRAIIYDAIAAGRIGRGERFRFREIASEVSIDCDDEPRFLSRWSVVPASGSLVDGTGIMDGFDYFGSIIALGHGATVAAEINDVDAAICGTEGVWGGASALSAGGLVAKFLASGADALRTAMAAGWSAVRQQLIDLPGFDLRKL